MIVTKFSYIKLQSICAMGQILTVCLSLILSVLLFTSVAESRLSWLLLAAVAVALEVGKMTAIHDNRRAIAGVLIAVSILGSAGGLSKSISVTGSEYRTYQQQQAALLAEIDQNNRMIDRYIELDRMKTEGRPLQQRNRELREQLAALPVVEVSAMQSSLNLIAHLLLVPVQWVTSAMVLLLAVLLDLLTVSFIQRGQTPVTRITTEPQPPQPKQPVPKPDNVDSFAHSYQVFKNKLLKGDLPLTQRGCMREGWPDKLVRKHWARLQAEGLIEKQGNQFVWAGSQKQVSML